MFKFCISRIRFAAGFAALSGALLSVVLPGTALAQAESYPSKPVRFVISFPAGSATDQVARLVAPQFTKATGQAVVVENRGGGEVRLTSPEEFAKIQANDTAMWARVTKAAGMEPE